MKHIYHDGGRAVAGYVGKTGDCACRAIAIATGMPYQQVYDDLNRLGAAERKSKRRRGKSSARTGVHIPTIRRYLASLGWQWTPTMHIGSGCKVHLADGELPMGRLIVSVSRHMTTVIDGVIYDTHDPQRPAGEVTHWYKPGTTDVERTTVSGGRCCYGYFTKAER